MRIWPGRVEAIICPNDVGDAGKGQILWNEVVVLDLPETCSQLYVYRTRLGETHNHCPRRA